MKKLMILAVAMVAMAIGGKAEASFLVIDDFTDGQFVVNPIGNSTTQESSGPNILGGWRTVTALRTSGGGASVIALNDPTLPVEDSYAPPPSLGLSVGGTSIYSTTITYDSTDANSDGSLGGINLLTGGAQGLILTVDSADQGAVFKFTVYDANYNSYDSVISPAIMAPTPLFFSWASFQPAVLGDPQVDFSNVTKIVLTIEGLTNDIAIDWRISNIRTGVVPEPTSIALAGFAGIGMAVGAIRRRRQAKQAA